VRQELEIKMKEQPIWRNFQDEPSQWEVVVNACIHFFMDVYERSRAKSFKECIEVNSFTIKEMYKIAKIAIPEVLLFKRVTAEEMMKRDLIRVSIEGRMSKDYEEITQKTDGSYQEYIDAVYFKWLSIQ
jgi:hypothetical protein